MTYEGWYEWCLYHNENETRIDKLNCGEIWFFWLVCRVSLITNEHHHKIWTFVKRTQGKIKAEKSRMRAFFVVACETILNRNKIIFTNLFVESLIATHSLVLIVFFTIIHLFCCVFQTPKLFIYHVNKLSSVFISFPVLPFLALKRQHFYRYGYFLHFTTIILFSYRSQFWWKSERFIALLKFGFQFFFSSTNGHGHL